MGDIHGAHPIHFVAQMCGHVNGISGPNPNTGRVKSSVYGVSPSRGQVILKRLLEHGVPIDVRDQDGRQPVLWASSAG